MQRFGESGAGDCFQEGASDNGHSSDQLGGIGETDLQDQKSEVVATGQTDLKGQKLEVVAIGGIDLKSQKLGDRGDM